MSEEPASPPEADAEQKPDVMAEFGVRDAADLLAKLDALYLQAGRRRLRRGSFPTTPKGVLMLADLYRCALRGDFSQAPKRQSRRQARPRMRPGEPPASSAALVHVRMLAVPLPAEAAGRFGLHDSTQLVRRLDTIYLGRGDPPLPESSYPTSKAKLRRLLDVYRDELARTRRAASPRGRPSDDGFGRARDGDAEDGTEN